MANNHTPDLISQHKTTLKAFSRAMQREAHVLMHQPDLLWQQMFNRLQWEGEGIHPPLAQETVNSSLPRVEIWLRLNIPHGRLIQPAGTDKVLRVWENSI
jgi:hypothetical protein